jgi:hypothetical protein
MKTLTRIIWKHWPVISAFTVLAIVSCAVSYLGWNFGKIKALEFISSVVISFLLVVFVFEPARIFLVAAVKTLVKLSPPKKPRTPFHFEIPEESRLERLRQRANHNFQMLRQSLIEPIGQLEQERLRRKMKREHELEKIFNELIIFLIFLAILTVLVVQSRHQQSFYSTKNVEDLFFNEKFSSDSFDDILSDDDLKFYVEHVFLPRIHEGKDEKGKKIVDGNGWISGKFLRVLGVPRLVQSRVKFVKCEIKFCSPEFSGVSQETEDFTVAWNVSRSKLFDKRYWRVTEPWKFRSSFDLKSVPHFGVIANYQQE